MYQIIDRNGQAFGPAPIETLRQWAIERRLTPEMTVVDQTTGFQGLASEMLLGMGVFLDPIPPTDPQPALLTPVQAVSYAFKGSTVSGEPPMLQPRLVAFFIDFILGMMVYGSLNALWQMLFRRFNYTTWGIFDYLDYLFIPAVMLYFVLRDAAFDGQSIGKRIANLKVVTTNGKPFTVMQSILRNTWAVPIFFLPVAGINYVAIAALILASLADAFMVLTQGKRIGDNFAFTAVVNA